MHEELLGRRRWQSRFTAEAVLALEYLEGLRATQQRGQPPIILAYHPVARTNPYQQLLYSRLWDAGVAPVPLFDIEELDEAANLPSMGATVVLHLHWTADVLKDVEDRKEAAAAVDAFLARLDGFRAAGGQLVWTVHNVLPHDCRLPDSEVRLRQGIADRATLIHILAEDTPRLVAEHYRLPPDKTVHVPHPNYIGVYPDHVNRDQARYELGVLPGQLVYAYVGAVREYKGVDRLLDAFDMLLDDPDHQRSRLVIAGGVVPGPDADALRERCLSNPFVTLHPRRISEAEMQHYLKAADVVVLPYYRSLNSGVALLALSFGRPIVAPDAAGIREVVDEHVARLFDPDAGHAALRDAMASAADLAELGTASRALRRVRPLDPLVIGSWFARLLRERVSAAAPTDGASGGDGQGWQEFDIEKAAATVETRLVGGAGPDSAYWREKPVLSETYIYPRTLRATDVDRGRAKRLLGGEFSPHRSFDWLAMSVPPAWDANPLENRTWDFYRHSLEWALPLALVGFGDDDLAARGCFIETVTDWIRTNSTPPGATNYAWFDHAASIRLRLFCWFWEIYRTSGDVDTDVVRLLLASIEQHARYMCDEANYNPRSNHGLEMMGALLSAGVTFPEFGSADGWSELACHRLAAYVAEAFSPEGLNREQSPSYHFFVLQRLAHLVRFARANGVSLPENVQGTLRDGLAAGAYLVRPDHSVPRFGDSAPGVSPGWQSEFTSIMGEPPPPPAPSTHHNPRTDDAGLFVSFDAGYAIFTSYPPGTDPSVGLDTHVAFKCNYFEYPHFHNDGLSFVLYSHGREWLIDPGLFNYEWEREERKYMKSSRAHNVVLVDGEDFSVHKVELENVTRSGIEDVVAARHELPSAQHRRTLRFRPPRQLLVTDVVSTRDGLPHRFQQLFHVAPDLEISVLDDRRIELQSPDGQRCLIEQHGSKGGWSVIEGQREPELQGWVSPSFGVLEPAPVLVWEVRDVAVHTLQTVIEIVDDEILPGEA